MIITTALLPLFVSLALAGSEHHHDLDKTSAGYKQLVKLTSVLGEWEGKHPDGKPVRVWYKLVSGGSTLLETEKIDDEPEMITVYHLDKDALVMTHYCSVNNAPHMRAQPSKPDAKQFEFLLESAANLSSPDAGHMAGLVLQFVDADHLTQRWTWREKGKEKVLVFKLNRAKKPS